MSVCLSVHPTSLWPGREFQFLHAAKNPFVLCFFGFNLVLTLVDLCKAAHHEYHRGRVRHVLVARVEAVADISNLHLL